MRLKRIELIGFKSFADRTAFEFEGSLTALVGPNGAGKSNVVDALRWVLGEHNARKLRGLEMSDMIYSGSASRKPLGCAEVRITMQNDRGLLPLEYDEVCIARRCYRSGQSEYFLNSTPCRLKDIRRLLMDTGVGLSAYNVIEQGRVDMLLRAGSKERRQVLEEAPGINRYLDQKKEAQSKLERVRVNLERVGDIIQELERQLRSVRYQAARARRYKRYSDELRTLRLALALQSYRGLLRDQSENTDAVAGQEALLRGLEERTGAVGGELSARRDALEGLRAELSAAQERLTHIDARRYGLAKEAELNRKRCAELRARCQELQQRSTQVTKAVGELRSEIADTQKQLEQNGRQLQDRGETRRHRADELKALEEQSEELERRIEGHKAAVFELLQQESQLQNQIGMLSAERQTLDNRLKRRGERAAQIGQQCERIRGERATAERKLAKEMDKPIEYIKGA